MPGDPARRETLHRGGRSAVDHDILPGHRGQLVRNQQHGERCDLMRRHEAIEWNRAALLALEVIRADLASGGLKGETTLLALGHCPARTDRVDANVVACQLARDAAREIHHRSIYHAAS